MGGGGWGWPAVPCTQSATQPSHTKYGWRHSRRRLPIAGAKSARTVVRGQGALKDKICAARKKSGSNKLFVGSRDSLGHGLPALEGAPDRAPALWLPVGNGL